MFLIKNGLHCFVHHLVYTLHFKILKLWATRSQQSIFFTYFEPTFTRNIIQWQIHIIKIQCTVFDKEPFTLVCSFTSTRIIMITWQMNIIKIMCIISIKNFLCWFVHLSVHSLHFKIKNSEQLCLSNLFLLHLWAYIDQDHQWQKQGQTITIQCIVFDKEPFILLHSFHSVHSLHFKIENSEQLCLNNLFLLHLWAYIYQNHQWQ